MLTQHKTTKPANLDAAARSQGLGQVIKDALDGGIDIGRVEVRIPLLQNVDEVGAEHARMDQVVSWGWIMDSTPYFNGLRIFSALISSVSYQAFPLAVEALGAVNGPIELGEPPTPKPVSQNSQVR